MNRTIWRTDACFQTACDVVPGAPEDLFATLPIKAVQAACRATDEEEVYTDFEAAISSRLLALRLQRSIMTGALSHTAPRTDALAGLWASALNFHVSYQQWQNRMLHLGLACMLLLIGFDVMGLLVLFAR
jgi:hypothetical protein